MNKYISKASASIILATTFSVSALGNSNPVTKRENRVQGFWQAAYQHVANNSPVYTTGGIIALFWVADLIRNYQRRPALAPALFGLDAAYRAYNGAGAGGPDFGGARFGFDNGMPPGAADGGASEVAHLRINPEIALEEAVGLVEEMPSLEPIEQAPAPVEAEKPAAAAKQNAEPGANDEAVRVHADDPRDALYLGGYHLRGARAERDLLWQYELTEEEANQPGYIHFEDNQGGGPIRITPGHTQPFVTLTVMRTRAEKIIINHPYAILVIDQSSYEYIRARGGFRGFISITVIGNAEASVKPLDRTQYDQLLAPMVMNLDNTRVAGTFSAQIVPGQLHAPVLIVRATNSEIAAFATNHPNAILIIDERTRDRVGDRGIEGFKIIITVNNILEFNDAPN